VTKSAQCDNAINNSIFISNALSFYFCNCSVSIFFFLFTTFLYVTETFCSI